MDFSEYEYDFFASFGNMILSYNNAEEGFRRLLFGLVTPRPKSIGSIALAKAMTDSLDNMGIALALKCFANDIADSKLRTPILHAVEYMDRLRPYRNFYVHGITSIQLTNTGPKGWIHTHTAKGLLREHKTHISKDAIDELADQCRTAQIYFNNVGSYQSYLAGDFESGMPEPKLPSAPPLPKNISKPMKNWADYFR